MAADLSALQPAHRAYFAARLAAFRRSLAPWLTGIAQFRARYHGITAATTEPVADDLLSALGVVNLTPFRFQAGVMNGVDPAPQDIASEQGLLGRHRARFFAYNEQVTTALTAAIRQTAISAGVPVVAVYETMPPGYRYQQWMLAELHAIERAVASKTSTLKL
jgi:zinc/manganese transport system substrate-binding protein